MLLFYTSFYFFAYNKIEKYQHDDLTLVSAYYKIKSKHTPEQYLKWINNIVLLNIKIKDFMFNLLYFLVIKNLCLY